MQPVVCLSAGLLQGMTCGDLRAAAAAIEALERFAERQIGLGGIPPFCQTGRHRLTPRDFHAEALEAERSWTLDRRVALVPETVTCLLLPAGGAQPFRLLGASRPRRSRRSILIERDLLSHEASLARGCDRLGPLPEPGTNRTEHGTVRNTEHESGKRRGGKEPNHSQEELANLFRLPLDQFTAARNALAGRLKKNGHADRAEQIKGLNKPPLSAWAVNQLFWRERKLFDALLSSGANLRNAQATQLAGRKADLRGALDAHRQALSALATHATGILRAAGHSQNPDTLRRVTTTLEALAAYGDQPEAPQPGFLTTDVDAPGFEALAALVPRMGDGGGHAGAASRVLPFQHKTPPKPSRKKLSAEEAERAAERERRAKAAEAKARVQDAERTLRAARTDVGRAEAALKKAAAASRDAEKERADLEKKLEKATAAADAAKHEARRIASEAEDAAQALADAEATLESARETLKEFV